MSNLFGFDLLLDEKILLENLQANNPIIIPRNHNVEDALEAANNNNLKPINLLLSFLEFLSQGSTVAPFIYAIF